MLPTEDAIWAGEELRRRFGLPAWQFTLSATDANRFSLRLARHITGRSKVVVHDHCYHGSVDETFAVLDEGGRVRARHGSIGPGVDVAVTTRVVDYNDVDGLARALADRDVAAVLIEPALTNVGIVLPAPGYMDAVRALTRETGTILIIDETHTICAGPGGATGAWDLEPDMLVIGKTIGGGIPVATYGMNGDIAERVRASITVEESDVGGIGGTLAGYALGLAAVRATLGEVLTDEAFATMLPLGERWAAGVEERRRAHDVPWHVTRLGAEPSTTSPDAATDRRELAAGADFELERFLHLFAMNRRQLLTPFHNMALMSPATTAADVDAHTAMFEEAAGEPLRLR